jgi:hypothetical protein
MPTLTPEQHAFRRACGLPAIVTLPPKGIPVKPDLDEDAALTTTEAARAAHVSEDTIRDWARRKLIRPINPDAAPPLYLASDVLGVEAETRRAARTRRLAAEAAQDSGSSGA